MGLYSVNLLISKVTSVIENEARLIGGVRDELNELRHELESMRSFLEDAAQADGKRKAQTTGVKGWVANVRDLTHQVEDIIDEFTYHMNHQQQQQHGGRFISRLLRKTTYFPKDLCVRRRIAKKLQKVNRMIKVIPERNQRYGVDHPLASRSSPDHHQSRWVPYHAESSLFVKDDDLVGIEDARLQLQGWLMAEELQRTVISVVGMGGSGKTTLAAKSYNSPTVKRNFDCYAWITVSQNYQVEDLLKSMINEFYLSTKEVVPMDLSSMRYKELLEIIVNYLRPKRYVVVFDDVWSSRLWRDIHISLPDEGLGSRVMLTTRMEYVASSSFGIRSYVHYMKPLDVAQSWELFCMKSFSNNQSRCCPPELKNVAQDLVVKCEGLPIAIVALGGVMSSKYIESDWRRVYNSLSWELSNNPGLDSVKTVLLLSFNDLPYRLKCCFLYCCLFPENYPIRRKRLIRLWMAEGFVEKVKGRTPEEVAENYYMELIGRSMLQVVQRDGEGRPKACKMHDLMREVALSIAESENFCAIYDGREANIDEITGSRRLSIQAIRGDLVQSWKSMSKLRSLLVFAVGLKSSSPTTLETLLPRGIRLLRVLDMQDLPIKELPDEIGDLYNLRYLSLRRTRVKELAKSIGRLSNLETLDIRNSEIQALPAGITKLKKLRHLIMYRCINTTGDFHYICGMPTPSDIWKLKDLQVMTGVEANADLMKRVRNMTKLKRFGITKLRAADEEDLCIAVENMSLLQYLFVMVADEHEYLRMDALPSAPPYLKTLTLVGKLAKVPSWFHSLQNLNFLYLHWSRLEEDVLPYIQALPNLGRLGLVNACEGRRRICFSTGFHKVRQLYLCNFPQLNEIIIGSGVMTGLQELWIAECLQLKRLPDGIMHLRDLELLSLGSITSELEELVRGERKSSLGHIPRVIFWCGRHFTSKFYHERLSDSTDCK